MAILIDRISEKPGRRKITPENGAPYYATIEMADEPVVTGTPVNRKNVIDTARATQKREIARFTSSGVWICPEGIYEIDVYLVGGGSGGRSYEESVQCQGGGGGFCKLLRNVVVEPQRAYQINVGVGGQSDHGGGDTSAFGVTAAGGTNENGGSGGGGTCGRDVPGGIGGAFGGAGSGEAGGAGAGNIEYAPVNPYDGIPYGSGGGGVGERFSSGGPGGGAGGIGANSKRNATDGDIGGGGGGGWFRTDSGLSEKPAGNGGPGGGGGGGGYTVGGRGGDGLVIIYGAEVM